MAKSADDKARPSRPSKFGGTDQGDSAPASLFDLGIPSLSAALNPSELSKLIGLLPTGRWSWGAPEEARVEVLRWHPSTSCAFEILIRAGSGSPSLIGKVYAKDRQDVFETMEAIWGAGFTGEAETSIPQPIAYLPSLRLLLQEKVEGLQAREIFKYGDAKLCAAAAERCARYLARFHGLAPSLGRSTSVDKMLKNIQHWHRLVSKEGGALASKSEQLVKRLKAAASRLGSVPMCSLHGDFGSQNIIFAGRRTVAIDWDFYAVGDPACDVARFIFGLELLALQNLGSIRELDAAADAFLAAYLALAPSTFRILEHLPFYKAARCLWRTRKDVRDKPLEWREWADAMLDEGLRTLEKSAPEKDS
jgi:aminoglycoside phosphotransferase (APT) family kinase protein